MRNFRFEHTESNRRCVAKVPVRFRHTLGLFVDYCCLWHQKLLWCQTTSSIRPLTPNTLKHLPRTWKQQVVGIVGIASTSFASSVRRTKVRIWPSRKGEQCTHSDFECFIPNRWLYWRSNKYIDQLFAFLYEVDCVMLILQFLTSRFLGWFWCDESTWSIYHFVYASWYFTRIFTLCLCRYPLACGRELPRNHSITKMQITQW